MAIRVKKTAEIRRRDLIDMLKAAGLDVKGARVDIETTPPADPADPVAVIATVTWVDVDDEVSP